MHSRETHLKMAQGLREAKKYLIDGSLKIESFKTFFVCYAIERASSKIDLETRNFLDSWIDDQLGHWLFVTSWLCYQTGVDLNSKEKQEYRHAWIDHMIKVLES